MRIAAGKLANWHASMHAEALTHPAKDPYHERMSDLESRLLAAQDRGERCKQMRDEVQDETRVPENESKEHTQMVSGVIS